MAKRLRNIAFVSVLSLCFIMAAVALVFKPITAKADAPEYTNIATTGASLWGKDPSAPDYTDDTAQLLEAAGWGSSTPAKPTGYDDSVSGELHISTAAAFAYFSHEVYSKNVAAGTKVYLESDIDLLGKLWIPIGDIDRDPPKFSFSGTFDGKNHTIYNLCSDDYINGISYDTEYYVQYGSMRLPFGMLNSDKEYCYGLFGVASDVTFKNVKIKNVQFHLEDKEVTPSHKIVADSIGALVGFCNGSVVIENCTAGSKDTNDVIYSKNGKITSGGLVGRAYTKTTSGSIVKPFEDFTVSNCVNYVNIIIESGTSSGKTGGILGYAAFCPTYTIENCENYGEIRGAQFTGGITGYYEVKATTAAASNKNLKVNILNCKNHGNVIGYCVGAADDTYKKSGGYDSGGIIGNFGLELQSDATTRMNTWDTIEYHIDNCVNYGNVSGSNRMGAIIGSFNDYTKGNVTTTVNNCFNYGNVSSIGVNATTDGIAGGFMARISSENKNAMTVSGGNSGTITAKQNSTVSSFIAVTNSNKAYASSYYIDAAPSASPVVSNEAHTATFAAPLVYSETDPTVVVGINTNSLDFNPYAYYSVDIPAFVTKIDDNAFAGAYRLAKINFAENSNLTQIGDWAFAGTGIASVTIPDSVTDIGNAAFAQCGPLTSVVLNSGVKRIYSRAFGNNKGISVYVPGGIKLIECSADAFDNDAYFIAVNVDAYNDMINVSPFAEESVYAGRLTRRIVIDYNNDGMVTDSEIRLYKRPYTLMQQNGRWTAVDSTVKTILTAGKWAASEGGAPLTLDDVNDLLQSATGNTITLYAVKEGKSFIARNDIVYTGATYNTYELNSLLYTSSDKITSNMRVEITGYTNPAGVAADSGNLPAVIKNAGAYELKITEGEAEYPLTINIARKAVELSDSGNIVWRITDVGGVAADTELGSQSLYIYRKTTGGDEYPSATLIESPALNSPSLNDSAVRRDVRSSVARYRGSDIEICLAGAVADKAYQITSAYAGNSGSNIGTYNASVTIGATDNYELTLSRIPSDFASRGITVTKNNNGTFTITKTWYIVSSNWTVDLNYGDYNVNTVQFGNVSAVSVPRLAYGDVNASSFGTTSDPVTLTLTLNGVQVGGEFTRDEFNQYINNSMPYGEYTLTVNSRGVEVPDPQNASKKILHGAFNESFNFTVEQKTLPDNILNRVDSALKGKQFTYEWDGSSHFYDSAAATAVNAAFMNYAVSAARTGKWASSDYSLYYSELGIEVNPAYLQNDVYYGISNFNESFSEPGSYKIYYRVNAGNHYSSSEVLASNADRTDYYFTVVITRGIELPTVAAATYNKTAQKAEIAASEYYTVVDYNGFTDAGTHKVTLALNNPEYYYWKDVEGNAAGTAEVDFVINKAINDWLVKPDVKRWVEGRYSKSDNLFSGAALYGDITYVITDISGKKVYYSEADGINKLNSLKAGHYYLRAQVDDSLNYSGLNEAFNIRVLEKEGLPWWAVLLVVLGSLALVALVLFILWKAKVIQVLTRKITVAIRTRATVEATIASVRAQKMKEESEASIALANKRARAEERKKARAAEASKPESERAAALEEKARAAAMRAEKMRARAEAMAEKANIMRERASKTPASEEAAATQEDNKTNE